MESSEPTKDFVEVDGIRFETVMPERIIKIPPKQPKEKLRQKKKKARQPMTGTNVEFGVRITNNTETPQRFLLFYIRPDFLRSNDERVSRSGPSINGSYNPFLSDFQLIPPSESLTFMATGDFFWYENNMRFHFSEKDGSHWEFEDFNSGTYRIQVNYNNPCFVWEQHGICLENSPVSMKPAWNHHTTSNPEVFTVEDAWTGEITSPPLQFDLVESRSNN